MIFATTIILLAFHVEAVTYKATGYMMPISGVGDDRAAFLACASSYPMSDKYDRRNKDFEEAMNGQIYLPFKSVDDKTASTKCASPNFEFKDEQDKITFEWHNTGGDVTIETLDTANGDAVVETLTCSFENGVIQYAGEQTDTAPDYYFMAEVKTLPPDFEFVGPIANEYWTSEEVFSSAVIKKSQGGKKAGNTRMLHLFNDGSFELVDSKGAVKSSGHFRSNLSLMKAGKGGSVDRTSGTVAQDAAKIFVRVVIQKTGTGEVNTQRLTIKAAKDQTNLLDIFDNIKTAMESAEATAMKAGKYPPFDYDNPPPLCFGRGMQYVSFCFATGDKPTKDGQAGLVEISFPLQDAFDWDLMEFKERYPSRAAQAVTAFFNNASTTGGTQFLYIAFASLLFIFIWSMTHYACKKDIESTIPLMVHEI